VVENFKKPLFWSNVASLTVVGIVAAGLVFAFNNPPATPPTGGGAIRVNSSGNVGIGTNPLAKLHVAGDILVDAGFGITLGGVKRASWLLTNNLSIDCGASTLNVAFCQIAAPDKIYSVISSFNGSIVTNIVNSVSAPGVTQDSSIGCGASTLNVSFCQIAAPDKIYSVFSSYDGSNVNMFVDSVSAPGVTVRSAIRCGANTLNAAFCQTAALDKIYSVLSSWTGSAVYMLVNSVSAPGVIAPK